ncbi:mobile mystery protein B [Thiothrix nivea]|uniref:Mobile mystery protein B n=1 Tax=Thiothrix nivea (strain ATCC 35100 / DSM 5205 / JP2) TaxID=870187 RepID=A0A656HF32_THINJ|nr:mobile mystery protein B [Thiothrix nivea]EIJ35037.1 mobile mystery protein B [Thiothrix nivea DSM 5205]
MNFIYPPGATPLDPDEAEGLLAGHITTQGDLNTWEQTNILHGELWATRQSKRDLLEERFVRELHQRMFDQTWKWAGTFRSTNKNIGVDWMQVGMQVRNLLDNTHYQMEYQIFSADELAVRFHHQLVMIHPFPNGNGRHARLMADLLIQRLGLPRFSWGGGYPLGDAGNIRDAYIAALRAADRHDIAPLLRFARS